MRLQSVYDGAALFDAWDEWQPRQNRKATEMWAREKRQTNQALAVCDRRESSLNNDIPRDMPSPFRHQAAVSLAQAHCDLNSGAAAAVALQVAAGREACSQRLLRLW